MTLVSVLTDKVGALALAGSVNLSPVLGVPTTEVEVYLGVTLIVY